MPSLIKITNSHTSLAKQIVRIPTKMVTTWVLQCLSRTVADLGVLLAIEVRLTQRSTLRTSVRLATKRIKSFNEWDHPTTKCINEVANNRKNTTQCRWVLRVRMDDHPIILVAVKTTTAEHQFVSLILSKFCA